ncbi:MAG: 3D domain-containing protein [Caldisericaceae bacterium]
MILILTIFFSFIILGHSYILSDDGTVHQVVSISSLDSAGIIEKACVEVRPEDVIYSTDESLTNSEVVTIKRSKPVQLQVDGKKSVCYTTAETVQEFLREKKISLNEKDYISAPPNTALSANELILINTYKEQEKIVKEPIAYKTVFESDAKVEKGLVFLKQVGKDGVLEKHYKEIFFGGQKKGEIFVYDKITKAPQTKIYVTGVASSPRNYLKTYSMVSTAYSPTIAETDSNPWMTATGLRSGFGVVAVDPKVIPLGSLLYVSGYGYAVAGDTGGAIKGNRIDVFFYSTSDATKWGIKNVKVYVLEGKWKFPDKLSY